MAKGDFSNKYRGYFYGSIPLKERCQANKLPMSSVTPLALEVAINVEKELKSKVEETERIRRQGVERARYEADQAR